MSATIDRWAGWLILGVAFVARAFERGFAVLGRSGRVW